YRLDVSGDANITGTYRVNGVPINATANWTQAGNNVYYTTGNVGIGTLSPQRLLHLTSSLPELAITNSGNAAGAKNFQFQLDASGNLNFHMVNDAWNSVQQSMVFTRTGNVGIGTTSAGNARLEVVSN